MKKIALFFLLRLHVSIFAATATDAKVLQTGKIWSDAITSRDANKIPRSIIQKQS